MVFKFGTIEECFFGAWGFGLVSGERILGRRFRGGVGNEGFEEGKG